MSQSNSYSPEVVLVTGSYDHEIRFWEAWSGLCSRTIQRSGESGQVNRLSISPDKRLLAAAIYTKVHIYDIAGNSSTPRAVFEGHKGNVTSVSFHSEGKWVVTGSEDGTIRIWDLRTSNLHRVYENEVPINDVCIHPNQGELISCDQAGRIRQWDLTLQEEACTVELAPAGDIPIRSISIASDGSCLVAGNNKGRVYVWKINEHARDGPRYQAVTKFQAHNKYLTRCLLSPDVKYLATCSADTTVKIWLVGSNYEFKLDKTLHGHQRWVWDAAFSADSAYLVTASSDHVARLWELSSGETVTLSGLLGELRPRPTAHMQCKGLHSDDKYREAVSILFPIVTSATTTTMAQPTETKSLHIQITKKTGIVEFNPSKELIVQHVGVNGKKTQKLSTGLKNVLYAEILPGNIVKIATLARQKKSHRLVIIEGEIREPDTTESAQVWVDELMNLAYGDVPPRRRFKVFVNPAGGQGKGVQLFEKKVKPILLAAHGEVDTVITKYSKHALELAQECALDFDALLTVSGDGLVFEVLNGFRKRPDAAEAFSLPVCPIPAGSGNALSISLLGPKDGPDVAVAALNAIKGRRMPYDLCSFTQDGETSVSFLSQAIGLMADLDLGTENMRWMGDARFIAGFLRGVASNKPCAMTLSIKVANRDKAKMVETLQEFKAGPKLATNATSVPEHTENTIAPRYAEDDVNTPGWFTFDKPVLYVYSGTMTYVSRDLMAFPVALPSDGMVDITVQELVPRPLMVKMISGGETGEQFWLPTQHYFKAEAYRLRPHASSGHLSIDGERFPYKEFHVETLKGLGTTLSMTGAWYSGDFGKGKTPSSMGNSTPK